jgi:hypothetical protein
MTFCTISLWNRTVLLDDCHSKSMGKNCYVDGVIYESVKECAKILNINESTVVWRMRSKSFPNYYYV